MHKVSKSIISFFLDLLYSIEEIKLLTHTPDTVFVTLEDILEKLSKENDKLRAKYQFMQFQIDSSIYSYDELIKILSPQHTEKIPKPIDKILQNLLSEKMIIVFPPENDKTNIRIRTKSLEVVRTTPYIGFIRDEHVKKYSEVAKLITEIEIKPNFIFAKRVIEEKKIPPRNISVEEFKSMLVEHSIFRVSCNRGNDFSQKFDPLKRKLFQNSVSIVLDSIQDVMSKSFKFSIFQVETIQNILFNSLFFSYRCLKCKSQKCFPASNIRLNKFHIGIEAPVGSGKTIAYILGPLIYTIYMKLLNKNKKQRINPTTLIIVPRRDLGLDLFKTNIGNIVNKIKEKGIDIKISLDAFGKENPMEIQKRYESDLVIANIESFKLRLQNQLISSFLNPFDLKYIIIDEIHLYHAFLGINTSLLLRRFLGVLLNKQGEKKRCPMFIGSSATVANLSEHMAALFPIKLLAKYEKHFANKYLRINHIEALEYASSLQGRINHLFFKKTNYGTLDGAFVNLLSFILHSFLKKDFAEKNPKNIVKTLAFIDSKRSIRQINQFFSQVEKKKVIINENSAFNAQQLFHTPVDLIKQLDPTIISTKNEKVCSVCKYRKNDGRSIEDWLNEVISLEYVLAGNKYGVLDKCFFYNTGRCWYHSEFNSKFESIDENSVKNIDERPFSEDSFLSRKYMAEISQERSSAMMQDDQLNLDSLFYDGENIYNVLLVTPVFEVGVNLTNVAYVFTLRSIQNIVSYKQKVGRGGRDYLSDIVAITVISLNPKDKQILRMPEIVADPNFIEPLSLKVNNEKLIEAHIIEATMDFFINSIFFFQLKKNQLVKDFSRILSSSINQSSLVEIENNIENIIKIKDRLKSYLMLIFGDLSPKVEKVIIPKIIEKLYNSLNFSFKSRALINLLQKEIGSNETLYKIYENKEILLRVLNLVEATKLSVSIEEQILAIMEDVIS
ncbi:MAG: DEAD/DEAH box helicase [Candidatus Heimdallarchaeaceae archaeon]